MVYPLDASSLRQHIVTTLEDPALERLIGAAQQDIDGRIGAVSDRVETHRAHGSLIGLWHEAQSVSEVIENGLTLEADDYELRGATLERLATGTNPGRRWWGKVKVTYAPVDDEAIRNRVLIGLVKLELDYTPGVASETVGASTTSSSQQQGVTYKQLRDEYLESLEPVGWLR